VRTRLTKGGVYLAVVLGIASGFYIWKPLFDPAEKDKWLKSDKPHTAGNNDQRYKGILNQLS